MCRCTKSYSPHSFSKNRLRIPRLCAFIMVSSMRYLFVNGSVQSMNGYLPQSTFLAMATKTLAALLCYSSDGAAWKCANQPLAWGWELGSIVPHCIWPRISLKQSAVIKVMCREKLWDLSIEWTFESIGSLCSKSLFVHLVLKLPTLSS